MCKEIIEYLVVDMSIMDNSVAVLTFYAKLLRLFSECSSEDKQCNLRDRHCVSSRFLCV